MKTSPKLLSKKALILSLGTLTLLGMVSWSPPTNENVLVSPGSVQVRNGVVEVKTLSGQANTYGTAPAAIIGSDNNIVRGGTTSELGRGIVIGSANFLSTPSSTYSAVIGAGNDAVASSSLIVGFSNKISYNPTDPVSAITSQNSTRYSVISGSSNTIGYDCETLLVGGKLNTVDAYSTLVSGWTNTVEGATVGAPAYHSAAIGQLNHIMATYGWTMGYSNTVSGSRGVAIGSGAVASIAQSTALGRFNAAMQSNDVLVVGTGTADDVASRNTALRITSDGGVILGRAQGDVSMGVYGN